MNTPTDLLRPFASLLAGRSALPLGPGAGAIAGFLTAAGADVSLADGDSWDGEPKRTFDFIIWIGAQRSASFGLPYKIAAALNDNGYLLMATDNPLGLSGFTDPFAYQHEPFESLGKCELTSWLSEAGLDSVDFYFPFPHMYQPSVLLSERAFRTPGFEVMNMVGPALGGGDCVSVEVRERTRLLAANGLLMGHSNSFFLVASAHGIKLLPDEILGFSFNASRSTAYNKINTFYQTADKVIRVRRTAYGDDAHPVPGLPAIQILAEERYLPGRLYSLGLDSVLAKAGWSVKNISTWARPYLELLKRYADSDGYLDGIYIDLTPFNLLMYEGSLKPVDLEWKAVRPVPLRYVFFRGLYHTLARMAAVRQPVTGTPLNLYGLALAVSEKMFDATTGLLELFLDLEEFYFGAVFADKSQAPGDTELTVVADPLPRPNIRAGAKLYPLLNCNLQVFVESRANSFSEETSAVQPIGLTRERQMYIIPLPHFTGDVTHLRVDPSDRIGLLCIHSVTVRTVEGTDIYQWTPYSRSDVQLSGVVIVQAGPALSDPVIILLNHDPMLIFPLPGNRPKPERSVVLEIELSALSEPAAEHVLANFRELCQLLPESSTGIL